MKTEYTLKELCQKLHAPWLYFIQSVYGWPDKEERSILLKFVDERSNIPISRELAIKLTKRASIYFSSLEGINLDEAL